MWIRIARFEGADSESWDDRIEEIRSRIRGGGPGGERPPAKRVIVGADRQTGLGANVILCDNEEDVRRVDEFMNQQTPPGGGGTRKSSEIYEVVIDEEPS